MARSQDAEMAVIQGGQLRLIEPFDDREHGRVYEPYVDIRVWVTNLADRM